MKSMSMMMAMVIGIVTAPLAMGGVIDDQLKTYQSEGAGNFSAEHGKALWTQQHAQPGGDKARSCSTCHGENLTQPGKHARTGKPIEPMAPSVNPTRFTDAAKIEKWFKRNCGWTMGRECSPQEKGDILSYLRTL